MAFLKEQEAMTETRRDEIRTLVKKLRKEPFEYFRRALERAKKSFEESEHEDLEHMLSIRETELKYEKGEFGSLYLFRLIISPLTNYSK